MNMREIREAAKKPMQKFCKLCPSCDGKACAGRVPGMGGALTGSSFTANFEALRNTRINLRVIHGAEDPIIRLSLFGQALDTPILAAPMTGAGHNCGEGLTEEDFVKAVVLGAESAGSLGWIGDAANLALFEAGLAAAKASKQGVVAIIKPRKELEEIVLRFRMAEEAGAVALGLDLDGAGLVTMRLHGQPVGPKTVEQLKAIRGRTKLPFVIKGVMTVDEALLCREAGADCIVVSNHGGRVLDGCPGAADVLADIACALDGKLTILADGCVRSGVDALKLMALGAQGVLVGRPLCWGAFADGAQGVATVIKTYTDQLYQAMIMTGCPSLQDIGLDVLY
ncbi:MAG: alpha-hydroxy-acid oxidizing protein [Candidatus Pelethousia sp.]|nr:alpha-hydroxy-acid oxidizing protein [Candidatus Pelethousia sp.]